MSDRAADYLSALRRALAPLPEAGRGEIVAEIGAVLADDPATAARLGTPEALARAYLDEHQMTRAVGGTSPGALLATMLARATRSGTALMASAAGAVLFALAASLSLIAVAKPVVPAHVGYWNGTGGVMFGLVATPPPGNELLGWWIVPVAIAGAIGCYLLATGLMRRSGRRLLRGRPTLG